MDNNFNIYWQSINAATYMYGARIYFDEAAHYHNPLVPAGTIIHAWYMTSNYDRDRVIPTLPMLMQNVTYILTVDMTCIPAQSAYFKLIIYATDHTVIETHFIETDTFEFTYPDGAYSYTLQLMSASAETITFRKVNIKMKDKPFEAAAITSCMNPVDQAIKTFIFEEPTSIRAYSLQPEVVQHINNVYIVRHHASLLEIQQYIQQFQSDCCLVSYGPQGSHIVKSVASAQDAIIDLFNSKQISPLQSVASQAFRLKALTNARIAEEVKHVQNS
ncbi:accessory Sec system protein Asp3 [Macrococcus capreoli]|uniref:accessory Sec system protein Asp3 n=1 Tax=Macrococcus capreoli TaxID=2982690 RepID=UPI003EE79F34